jgi:hydroxymethylpyrimidine/phosphomethylpyrimidine kinase
LLNALKQSASRARPSSAIGSEQSSFEQPPVALTIAGSDSSAGAGIQADLKTFSALGVYGLTVVTCIVAEVPGKVSRVAPASAKIVRKQIEALVDTFCIGAIKTGLLCSVGIVSTVAKSLRKARKANPAPLVIDPIAAATGGDPLLESAAMDVYRNELFPLATLITPNIPEAEQMLGTEIRGRSSMEQAGKELKRQFKAAILLKGGHLRGKRAVDLLFVGDKIVEFSAPFVSSVATHGTGCTLSAAIAAGLARGFSLEESIRRAKNFVTRSIARRLRLVSRTGKTLHALRHC